MSPVTFTIVAILWTQLRLEMGSAEVSSGPERGPYFLNTQRLR